ncbi:epimerase [Streptomyces sp. NPDC058001]|uniref:epimerase n=1 Tax=Streptomyces sp. NPDC058001 TaxID=3346300 RepID=UPI0036EF9E3A
MTEWEPTTRKLGTRMKAIIFGATGMVGQGVLRECLRDPAVTEVLAIGRTPTGVDHPKLREITDPDVARLMARYGSAAEEAAGSADANEPAADESADELPSELSGELSGYDACFFCLGVSSVGQSEEAYRRVTHDLTLTAARTLSAANPNLTFVYVSGQGSDSSEQGRVMWARVKGETENHLLALPMNTYLFRPGYIQPLHGITSKTPLYRALYAVARPLYPLIRRLAPSHVTTTEQLARAMINIATTGAPQRHLDSRRINAVARGL